MGKAPVDVTEVVGWIPALRLVYTERFYRATRAAIKSQQSCTKFRACPNWGDKAAICRATNRSEIASCSHARFAVAVKSPFDRSSCRAIKSLCVKEPLDSNFFSCPFARCQANSILPFSRALFTFPSYHVVARFLFISGSLNISNYNKISQAL